MDHNIAPVFGTVIAYSSQYNDATAASNLIDGHPIAENLTVPRVRIALGGDYTIYRSNDSPAWVIIDLGAERPLSGFVLWGSESTYGACVKDYRIALDNDASGSFVNVVVSSQIPRNTIYFAANLHVARDYWPIAPQSARYVKLFLDTPYGGPLYGILETMELEIIGPEVQQDTVTVTSNAEIYYPTETITVTSDAYIVPAPIVTETVAVTSNAEITDKRVDMLSDSFVAINVYSNANIIASELVTVQSDAMIYKSGYSVREIFTMGKGAFVGFPESRSTLIYCTDISSSDEVVVADMITSSIMDMADVAPPLGYRNYGWKYDWVVRTYDSAQYKFEIRTGETVLNLLASTFSPIVLGQVILTGEVPRYHQWRCHVWASGSGDFELHQFSIKGYIDHPINLLYSSLNPGEFTTVSNVQTEVDKPYEPMDMDRIWKGSYIPGDVNGDGVIDYSDVLYMTAWLYAGGPAPNPIRRADVNDTGSVNTFDITYLTAYLLTNGTPPYRWDEGWS